MNLSELFIRRPIMTTLVMLGILVFGSMAYRLLPVSNLPNVDFPTITVNASLPGASPETMASAVATPLEKQFSTIAGVDQMTSSSGLGSMSITLTMSRLSQRNSKATCKAAARGRTFFPCGVKMENIGGSFRERSRFATFKERSRAGSAATPTSRN